MGYGYRQAAMKEIIERKKTLSVWIGGEGVSPLGERVKM
jgi:hypothetical protein